LLDEALLGADLLEDDEEDEDDEDDEDPESSSVDSLVVGGTALVFVLSRVSPPGGVGPDGAPDVSSAAIA
jgi:hypothetical protein